MDNHKIAPENINNAPSTQIGAGGSQSNASIHDRTGLHISIIAMFAAVLALGMAIMLPQIVDSKVKQGMAEARADMQEQIAKAQADMHLAETNALLAKDRADKMAAALEARGLIKLENH